MRPHARVLRHRPAESRPRGASFTIAISGDAAELRLQVLGELDVTTADRFASCLGELRRHTASLSLDLTRVRFIDVSGLRILLEARREAPLRVVAAGRTCARLFDLTGTTELLSTR